MSSGGGWESIVGDLEADEPELERTPTDVVPPRFDEAPVAPVEPKPILDLKTKTREPLAQIALTSAPAQELAKKPLTLPKPGGMEGTAGARPAAPPALAPIAEGFSGGLMERLAVESPVVQKEPFLTEYKELLSAIGLTLLLLGGFATYKLLSSGEPEVVVEAPAQEARRPGQVPPPKQQPKPAPTPAPSPAPPDPQQAEADKAPAAVPVQPILSVMTVPAEATVEINGLVRGKSPLVMKSPSGSAPLRVKVTKNRYKTWQELVSPNETGHFVVKVVLEAR